MLLITPLLKQVHWYSSVTAMEWKMKKTPSGRAIQHLSVNGPVHNHPDFNAPALRTALYNYLKAGGMNIKISASGANLTPPDATGFPFLDRIPGLWPTLVAADYKGIGPLTCYRILCREKRSSGYRISLSLSLHPLIVRDKIKYGGQLNPAWLEWFMGFPTGWTAYME